MAILIRPLTIADTLKAVTVYSNTHAEDATVSTISAAEWERFFRQPVNDEGRGFLLAEDAGLPVAIATSSMRVNEHQRVRHFRIIVLPHYRRQRIGTRMLSRLLALDAKTTGVLLQCLCPRRWIFTHSFLERWGFFRVESEITMSLNSLSPPSMSAPTNFTVERVGRPSDLAAAVAKLHNMAYRCDASFVPYNAQRMAVLLDNGVELYVMREAGKVIGYFHAESGEDVLSIESLVINPGYQNKGLGTWLCSVAINDQFRRHKCQESTLLVSNQNLAALHVYRKLGFREIDQAHRYRAERSTLLSRIDSYDKKADV